ncbi:MAG: glycosyltransferase family 4 protein, partial [Leptothrix sp. (in: b-proteobacteria)]
MIVILYPQFHAVGGIARYLDAFLANLPPRAPTVVLVTGDSPPAGMPSPSYTGVELIQLPVPRGRFGLLQWSWRAQQCVAALQRRRLIGAINLHLPPLIPALLLGLFLSRDVPLVLTAHTTYLGMSGRFDANRHFKSPWQPLSLWLKLQMEHVIFARADRVITLTEQGRRELARYGRTQHISVVPNGVDLAQFKPDATVEPDIDVIFSGRIEKRKGSRPLAALCRQLVAAYPQIRIAIVGYGDDEAHVRHELADLNDNVLLTGKVSFGAMVSHYQRSRVYASTSYYEGLPGTCLEAMAMGLP